MNSDLKNMHRGSVFLLSLSVWYWQELRVEEIKGELDARTFQIRVSYHLLQFSVNLFVDFPNRTSLTAEILIGFKD